MSGGVGQHYAKALTRVPKGPASVVHLTQAEPRSLPRLRNIPLEEVAVLSELTVGVVNPTLGHCRHFAKHGSNLREQATSTWKPKKC
eukprot:4804357-Amphidinium_carterae.1